MLWFKKKPPEASIAGMSLTKDKAQDLLETCQLLRKDILEQTTRIDAFATTTRFDSIGALAQIQQHHVQVASRLDDIVLHVSASTEPWPKELDDAKVTMARKVQLCNHAARPLQLGWKQAAKQYWPLIAETHTAILAVLGRLEQELQDALKDEQAWTEPSMAKTSMTKLVRRASVRSCLSRKSKVSSDSKRVGFEREVAGRYYSVAEAPYEEDEVGDAATRTAVRKSDDFTTTLTNDKKATAGKIKRDPLLIARRRRASSVRRLDEVVPRRVHEDTTEDSGADDI